MPTRENPFARARQELRDVLRARTLTHQDLRDRLQVIIVVSVVVDAVCALLAYAFEHGARDTQIHGLGDALFFSTTQLLSVSSSITNPLSTGGRVLDVFMELYAITVIASLAGMTASFFHGRAEDRRTT